MTNTIPAGSMCSKVEAPMFEVASTGLFVAESDIATVETVWETSDFNEVDGKVLFVTTGAYTLADGSTISATTTVDATEAYKAFDAEYA